LKISWCEGEANISRPPSWEERAKVTGFGYNVVGRGGKAGERGKGFGDDRKGVTGGGREWVLAAVATFEEVVATLVDERAARAGSAHQGGRDAGKA
jgi:hypothetical protein